MKKDKPQSTFINIGSSFLLVIFLVLCLSTFAILSLSSAKSDYSFSERLAAHRKLYYEASSRAGQIVDELDALLSETAGGIDPSGLSSPDGGGPAAPVTDNRSPAAGIPDDTDDSSSARVCFADYTRTVAASLDGISIDGSPISCKEADGGCVISFQVPAGEKQALQVELLVTDHTSHPSYYEIKSWRTVSTGSWEGGQPLKLIPIGQEPPDR